MGMQSFWIFLLAEMTIYLCERLSITCPVAMPANHVVQSLITICSGPTTAG